MSSILSFDKRAIITGNYLHKVDPVAKADPLAGSVFASKAAAPAAGSASPVLLLDKKRAMASAQQRNARPLSILGEQTESDQLGVE